MKRVTRIATSKRVSASGRSRTVRGNRESSARTGCGREAAGIKAGLDLRDAARILPAGGSDKLLQRELAGRKEAGLNASWVSPAMLQRQTALASAGGMKLPDWGAVDPYQLTLGFLRAAIKKGVKVYERSRITKITFNRKNATAFLMAARSRREPDHLHRRADQPVQAAKAAPEVMKIATRC